MRCLVLLFCVHVFLFALELESHEFRGRSYMRMDETFYNTLADGSRGDQVFTHRLVVKPRENFPLSQTLLNQRGYPMFRLEPEMLIGGYYLLKADHLKANQSGAFELACGLSRLGMFTYM